ncbi:MAG TPA: hypothetical protein VGC42_28665 [Kofleriaceae bacterium]
MSVAGLLLAAAPLAHADAPAAKDAKVKCAGNNACKGTGACKGASNACKGQNACKGKGWTETASAQACKDAKGTIVTDKK